MTNKERALLVAEKAHQNQQYDMYQYIFHIRQVVAIAEELEYPEDVIIAATLHDVLEDTSLSYNDVKRAFGVGVAEIVFAVTDELGRNRKERHQKTYPKITANWKATVVKICDRIANVGHSRLYNQEMYEMYLRENDDFCRALMNPSHPHSQTNIAWLRLSEIFNQ
jgi:(p)ppGpp synthase/HD superfamily hydrolase